MEVMTTYPQKITFGEVRILRPRGLVYCRVHRYGPWIKMEADC